MPEKANSEKKPGTERLLKAGPSAVGEPPRPEVASGAFTRGMAGLAGAGLITKALGYARDALLVAFFGGGALADAYYAAFRLVNVFRRTVGEGALNAVFIPLLEKEKTRPGGAAKVFFSSAWTVIFFVSALLGLAGIIFSRQLVTAAAWGFKGAPGQLELTALLTAALMPHLLFVNVCALFTAALNSARRFFLPALAPAAFSLAVIGALLSFHYGLFSSLDERGKMILLAAAASASGLLQALTLLPLLKREGYALSFTNPLKDLSAAPALLAAVPALFRGTLDKHPGIYSTYKGKVIELDCGARAWYHLDGEDFFSHDGKLKFSALPGALKVIAPKQSLPEN